MVRKPDLLYHFHYRQQSALYPDRHSPVENFFTSGHYNSAAEAIDARDPYTRGHSDHVSQYASKTARGLGLSEKESQVILGVIKDFEKIRLMVRSHHEHYDGSGYPDGIKCLEIPLGARIIAVADVYDALTTDRPYRVAWEKEKALQTIQEKTGSHFDPQVVSAFIAIMMGT